MSKNEEVKNLEVEVELAEEKEAKKAEMVKLAKKVGKIAGVAAIGVVGYLIGAKVSRNSECNVTDLIEVALDNE